MCIKLTHYFSKQTFHPTIRGIKFWIAHDRSRPPLGISESSHLHLFLPETDWKPNTLLLGDSIIAGLSRHPNVWNEYFTPIKALNLGIGIDHVENALWQAIDLPLPSSVKNVVILCGTNNIPTDAPCDIADCIISLGSIFQKRSSGIDLSVCGLIPHNESWSVNRGLVNEMNEILKYQCNINGFSFIFQDHGWTFTNGSLDCSLFYKDLLHFIEQDNIKLVKWITLTITSWYKDINLSSTNINTSYSDITSQKVQSTIYLFFIKWARLPTII